MSDSEFNEQVEESEKLKPLMVAIESLVINDDTAFRALIILQHRIERLSDAVYEERPPYNAMALYYLASDLRNMLDEKEGYYQNPE